MFGENKVVLSQKVKLPKYLVNFQLEKPPSIPSRIFSYFELETPEKEEEERKSERVLISEWEDRVLRWLFSTWFYARFREVNTSGTSGRC